MVNMCALIDFILERSIPTDWQDGSCTIAKEMIRTERNYKSTGACSLIEPVMKVLESVIDEGTYQRKSRDRPDTNLINVFHANADAISYWDSTVY